MALHKWHLSWLRHVGRYTQENRPSNLRTAMSATYCFHGWISKKHKSGSRSIGRCSDIPSVALMVAQLANETRNKAQVVVAKHSIPIDWRKFRAVKSDSARRRATAPRESLFFLPCASWSAEDPVGCCLKSSVNGTKRELLCTENQGTDRHLKQTWARLRNLEVLHRDMHIQHKGRAVSTLMSGLALAKSTRPLQPICIDLPCPVSCRPLRVIHFRVHLVQPFHFAHGMSGTPRHMKMRGQKNVASRHVM